MGLVECLQCRTSRNRKWARFPAIFGHLLTAKDLIKDTFQLLQESFGEKPGEKGQKPQPQRSELHLGIWTDRDLETTDHRQVDQESHRSAEKGARQESEDHFALIHHRILLLLLIAPTADRPGYWIILAPCSRPSIKLPRTSPGLPKPPHAPESRRWLALSIRSPDLPVPPP
jgi:hypothetical protein